MEIDRKTNDMRYTGHHANATSANLAAVALPHGPRKLNEVRLSDKENGETVRL